MMETNNNQVDQKFYEFIKNYSFFNEGRLDVYAFSVYLSECLSRDNKYTSNNPNLIGQLLIKIVSESPQAPSWFQKLTNAEVPQDQFHIYPNGELILLHVTAFIEYIHQFIWTLGEYLQNINKANDDNYYAYWLQSTDVYSYAFLNKLFCDIRGLTKEVDSSGELKAQLQNIILTKEFEIDVTETLLVKDSITEIANARITKAIKDGYYLEAITLQESIISDKLALFLSHKKKQSDSKSLYELISLCLKINKLELFSKVDEWRKKRNTTIHGLVRSTPFEKQLAITDFDNLAKDTALQGTNLVKKIQIWFDDYVYHELHPFQIKPYDQLIGIKGPLN
ncbi:hypothetical protein RT723_04580 [Psychrosphaera aquimarina]|uniref:Apea-like HEPN domain-containing protein n=1 Tax=Psychrosphaera aquimarina TaxID=2044854 RepID=A0ABU3QXW6_9GAMM|nr:hypothetical protein [Psychrosphaera aquimarina]MDU0112284.1 hypothetical protein [Psychrosphaera aquimarina]